MGLKAWGKHEEKGGMWKSSGNRGEDASAGDPGLCLSPALCPLTSISAKATSARPSSTSWSRSEAIVHVQATAAAGRPMEHLHTCGSAACSPASRAREAAPERRPPPTAPPRGLEEHAPSCSTQPTRAPLQVGLETRVRFHSIALELRSKIPGFAM